MVIKKIDELSVELENMIGFEFSRFAEQHKVNVNYIPFYFIAEENEEVIGLITGHAYYNHDLCPPPLRRRGTY